MVVDRVHRAPRILGSDEKGILRDVGHGAPVRTYVGGVVLNHLGWAAALGLQTGIFGRQADDEGGRFLRAAMDRFGIERDLRSPRSSSTTPGDARSTWRRARPRRPPPSRSAATTPPSSDARDG
jgi:sugar/nucleoside kinase (ribokinase family)